MIPSTISTDYEYSIVNIVQRLLAVCEVVNRTNGKVDEREPQGGYGL